MGSGKFEKMLLEKMNEGWNVSIDCKTKTNTHEMYFEGSAYKPTSNPYKYDRIHARGNTLEELLINLFIKQDNDSEYIKNKKQEEKELLKKIKRTPSK